MNKDIESMLSLANTIAIANKLGALIGWEMQKRTVGNLEYYALYVTYEGDNGVNGVIVCLK